MYSDGVILSLAMSLGITLAFSKSILKITYSCSSLVLRRNASGSCKEDRGCLMGSLSFLRSGHQT